MDWAKAKNIFIIVLVLLNVFLLGYTINHKMGQEVSKETVDEAIKILNDKGITLECAIPSYTDDTPMLSYENGAFDRRQIITKLLGPISEPSDMTDNTPLESGSRKLVFTNACSFEFTDSQPAGKVDISGENAAEKYLRGLIHDLGLNASNFILDLRARNADNTLTFVFIEQYGKFPVFDNLIRIVLGDRGIHSINLSARKIRGFAPGSKTKVIPAYIVLLRNFSQGGNAVITRIEIGFKGYGLSPVMVESDEGPAWRLTFKDGTIRYFKASNGEEIE